MGSTSTEKVMRTRSVMAAAVARVTRISGLGKVMRSPAARLEKGPASMRRDHSKT